MRTHAPMSGNPPLLVVGAFLSESTGIRFVCEDLAEGLASRGWPVVTTSSLEARGPRLADMLASVWFKRRRYAVAQIDVYSGLAFSWAEAVAASLTLLRCPYVLTLHSGAFPEFAERWPGRVRALLESASAVTSPSPFLQQTLKTHRPDIRVIPNGLSLARYPGRRRANARPRMVWVRHFEQRYNPVLAVEVVLRLSGDYPDVELIMAGPTGRIGVRHRLWKRRGSGGWLAESGSSDPSPSRTSLWSSSKATSS